MNVWLFVKCAFFEAFYGLTCSPSPERLNVSEHSLSSAILAVSGSKISLLAIFTCFTAASILFFIQTVLPRMMFLIQRFSL